MKTNSVMNFIDEKAAIEIASGKIPVKVIYREELAKRLGITPRERLSLTVVVTEETIAVSCLLDGGDLTSEQNDIFSEFLRETGAFENVIGVFPERPITS